MSGVTIRFASDYKIGLVTNVGGAGSYAAAVSDAVVNDATYIVGNSGIGYPQAYARLRPVTGGLGVVGATERILRVRINSRLRANAATTTLATLQTAIYNPKRGSYDFSAIDQYNDAVTFTTRFGVWRTKPPSGFGDEWTVATLEQAVIECFFKPSVTGVNLRLSELYLDVEYRSRATVSNVSITNPSVTTEPTVTWTFNPNADGDPQSAYRIKVFNSNQYSTWGFDPDRVNPVWDSGVVISNATQVTMPKRLENGQTYAAYIQVAADFGGQKWWSVWSNSFPQTIILTPLPQPTMIGLTVDNTQLRNRIDVQSNLNHLDIQSADFNNAFLGIGQWISFFGSATTVRVTSPTAEGAGAMSATKLTGPGDIDLLTGFATSGMLVKPGQLYTALASLRSAATSRTISIGIGWYDRNGGAISLTYGTTAASSTSQWTQISQTVTAPAGAVYATVWVKIAAAALAEVHYMDKTHFGTGVIIGSGTISGTSGVSQPRVAAVYNSGYWSGGSKAIACTSIPPLSLLVAVTLSGQSASITGNVVTNTPTSVAWTNRQENTLANTGDMSISTAYFPAGGDTVVTVTAAGNQSSGCRTLVYAVTGHDESTFGGASNKAQATSGSASVSLTTTRENSLVIVGTADFNAVNGNHRVYRRPGQSLTEDFYGDFGGGTTYFSHYIMPSTGAATHGLTSPSGQAYGIGAIEIRGASFNTTTTVYTGWNRGGWVGQVSTVVERALVSTGARNNAHPNLWSGGDWYKNTDGFYLPEDQRESALTYDLTTTYDGQGCIRWDVNNTGSRLYMGWPDGPRWILEPQEPMLGIENKSYTFSLYAKADAAFDTTLTVQALNQFGDATGSASTSGPITLTTGWVQYTVNFVMPVGCLWVRADLENRSSVTERRVWVDGIQWVEGSTVDVSPGFGEGIAVDWQPIRGADKGEFLITDLAAGLIGSIWDTEAKPGCSYVYRASNYLPATETVPALNSAITFYATNKLDSPGRGVWILRDPNDNSLSIRLHVIEMSETMHEESQTFYPLRPTTWDQLGQRAVTITDFIGGFDGSLRVLCDSEAEWRILRQLLSRPRPLYLIFPEHGARYVRITDRSWERQTPRSNQQMPDSVWRRAITLNFLESDAP
jgi:hypothetical protein